MDSKEVIRIQVRDGELRFLWNDETEFLTAIPGACTIQRASYVEWDSDLIGWTANLAPSGGPVLGPFRLRTEALAAELDWLYQERGL
jgi:hypothetical protein